MYPYFDFNHESNMLGGVALLIPITLPPDLGRGPNTPQNYSKSLLEPSLPPVVCPPRSLQPSSFAFSNFSSVHFKISIPATLARLPPSLGTLSSLPGFFSLFPLHFLWTLLFPISRTLCSFLFLQSDIVSSRSPRIDAL